MTKDAATSSGTHNGLTVAVVIDGKNYSLSAGSHSVPDLKKIADVPQADDLQQDVNNILKQLDQTGAVMVSGGEIFVSFPAKVAITVNGKNYAVIRGSHSVSDLKKVADIPQVDDLQQDINNVLTLLDQHGSVVITGGEVFVSQPAKVEITIDGKPYKVARGNHTVASLKQLANIPAAYQLDQDVGGVLTPLDPNGTIAIKGGEVFVSYPASGTSS